MTSLFFSMDTANHVTILFPSLGWQLEDSAKLVAIPADMQNLTAHSEVLTSPQLIFFSLCLYFFFLFCCCTKCIPINYLKFHLEQESISVHLSYLANVFLSWLQSVTCYFIFQL